MAENNVLCSVLQLDAYLASRKRSYSSSLGLSVSETKKKADALGDPPLMGAENYRGGDNEQMAGGDTWTVCSRRLSSV